MSQNPSVPDRTPTTRTPPATPRWVKVFIIIGIVVVLLVAILLVTGLGGPHGPGRHMPAGEVIEVTVVDAVGAPPAGFGRPVPPTEDGLQPA